MEFRRAQSLSKLHRTIDPSCLRKLSPEGRKKNAKSNFGESTHSAIRGLPLMGSRQVIYPRDSQKCGGEHTAERSPADLPLTNKIARVILQPSDKCTMFALTVFLQARVRMAYCPTASVSGAAKSCARQPLWRVSRQCAPSARHTSFSLPHLW